MRRLSGRYGVITGGVPTMTSTSPATGLLAARLGGKVAAPTRLVDDHQRRMVDGLGQAIGEKPCHGVGRAPRGRARDQPDRGGGICVLRESESRSGARYGAAEEGEGLQREFSTAQHEWILRAPRPACDTRPWTAPVVGGRCIPSACARDEYHRARTRGTGRA